MRTCDKVHTVRKNLAARVQDVHVYSDDEVCVRGVRVKSEAYAQPSQRRRLTTATSRGG